ncbi:MAG TPA: ion transporter [Thalassobaculum sp.]
MLAAIDGLLNSRTFQWFIVGTILANAAILGLQTLTGLDAGLLQLLEILDNICLVIFCVEIALKLIAMRLGFFRDGWNIFDFLVVGVALVPASGELSVLRSMRVLRLMRLATALPAMRRVISGMFKAVPGAASVAGVLVVMYYVAAVMGTNFFRESNPAHFGDLGNSLFTLFKMMTLEGWPDIADEVLAEKPQAWPFFVIFIILTTFTTLNLMFGIIVGAMEDAKEEDARAALAESGIPVPEASDEVRLAVIENDVRHIREMLTAMTANANSPGGSPLAPTERARA